MSKIQRIFYTILFSGFSFLPVNAQEMDLEAIWKINNRNVGTLSALWLGRPYQRDPLGEGENGEYDQHPLFRTDTFDCTTYIESVLAAVLVNGRNSKNRANSLIEISNQIRYTGQPHYRNRNHFIEIDWVPNLQKLKLINDVTKSRFQEQFNRTILQTFNKHLWFQSKKIADLFLPHVDPDVLFLRLNQLHDEGNRYLPQENQLTYVKKEFFLDQIENVNAPAILNIVRKMDKFDSGFPEEMIVHQVLLIHENGVYKVRHASSAANAKKVVEQTPQDFFQTPLMISSKTVGVQVLGLSLD